MINANEQTKERRDERRKERGNAGTRGRGDEGTRGRGDEGTRGRGDEHHGLAKSIISSDLRAVFYSFSLRENFYPESHGIRRAACFWHDKKNNSDDRDSRLKR